MARLKYSFRDGLRDAYEFWAQMDVSSKHDYDMEVLKKQLDEILIPWNSSIEKILQPPPRHNIYRFIFGAADLTAADIVGVKIVCKMNEMEQRWEEMQRFHEPEGFMVPKHNARVETTRQQLANDCGFKRGV